MSADLRSHTRRGTLLTSGHNVDPIDIAAGLRELTACGYTSRSTTLVIQYALQRHARGEEAQAERGAVDASFHGISLTSWKRVLAAAIAAGSKQLAALH